MIGELEPLTEPADKKRLINAFGRRSSADPRLFPPIHSPGIELARSNSHQAAALIRFSPLQRPGSPESVTGASERRRRSRRIEYDVDTSSEVTILTKVGAEVSGFGSHSILPPNIARASSGRARWRTRLDYIVTCCGFAVGLPSVWRFPHVCYENGGGSFLIAYLLLSVSIGIPMYQLELSLGQSLQTGFLRIWPAFSHRLVGLGLSSVILAFLCSIYFSAINTWTLFYFIASLYSPHPWQSGGNSDADSALKYYFEDVLHKSPSIRDYRFADVNLNLVLCLILSCVLTFLTMAGGSTRTTAITAFAALFPTVGLLTLLSQALQLDGSLRGLKIFLIPSLSKILSLRLWGRALLQVFFSCGIGWGSLVNFASFSDPRNDFRTDAWVVLTINVVTSLLAGLTTFALVGHVASSLGVESIDNVIQAGSGMIFIVFPTVLEAVPWSRGLTTLFFLLIVALGLSSLSTMMTLVQTGLDDLDVWKLLSRSDSQLTRASVLAMTLFACALPLILPNGIYMVDLLDSSTGAIALLAVPLAEVLAVTRIAKYERFAFSVRRNTGQDLRIFFRVILKYVLPILLGALIVGALSDFSEARVRQTYRLSMQSIGCPSDCFSSESHGMCNVIDRYCQCHAGWEGVDCNTKTANPGDIGCPAQCNKQGICDYLTGECKCNADFFGPTCAEAKYDESLPWWTILFGWMVALGSLCPGLVAALSPRCRSWLLQRMLDTKEIVSATWTADEASDEEEYEDSRLGIVTYKV